MSFIAFSQAILTIPVSPLWAVLFYLMFFLLGLGSQFGSLEVIITVVYDNEKIQKIRKEITVGKCAQHKVAEGQQRMCKL